MLDVIVVDADSSDGTREFVDNASLTRGSSPSGTEVSRPATMPASALHVRHSFSSSTPIPRSWRGRFVGS